jgi:hypothetical protein
MSGGVSQKIFTVSDEAVCVSMLGLGNRCSILLSYGTMPEKRRFVNP